MSESESDLTSTESQIFFLSTPSICLALEKNTWSKMTCIYMERGTTSIERPFLLILHMMKMAICWPQRLLRQKYAPQEVIRLLVAHLDYHLVVGGDPQIASGIAEAMFEALPPFFAQCIFCMWLGITGFKLQHFSVKTLVKKFHWVFVPFIYFDFLNMSQLLVLGKVESGGGPIFKVVLEC